jgi:hypothetical protein
MIEHIGIPAKDYTPKSGIVKPSFQALEHGRGRFLRLDSGGSIPVVRSGGLP